MTLMLRNLHRLIGIVGVAALLAAPVRASAQQTALSQSSGGEGIGIGIKGGPLFSTLSVANATDISNRTGFTGGLFLGGNRSGVVGVGVDLMFARRGAKEKGTSETLDMDYLNVPVYARINAGSASRGGAIVYGIIGVDLNFLLKAKFSTDTTDSTDDFQRADYGVVVGLGAEITRFIIEGRYSKGLGNIAKNKNDPEIKSQSFAILIGVRLN